MAALLELSDVHARYGQVLEWQAQGLSFRAIGAHLVGHAANNWD